VSGPAAPAGYQRIGGTAQGVSLDVPSSWVAVNFSQESLQQAIKLFGLTGTTQSAFTQELEPLVKAHAVYAADIHDAGSSPGHFVTNINAYCSTSGVSQSGSAGVTALGQSWASQLQQLGAQNVTQTGAELGGVAGEESSYTLSASSTITLHATQLEVLPKAGQACYVTLTAAGSAPAAVLAEVISSIQYP
jgi:4-hydroxy-3-methylbut-2-enyl diphosphate reductase IspH